MTREEAYNWNENSHDLRFTGEVEDMQESIYFLITKIYKHHEAQLKKKQKWGMSMRDSAHKFKTELNKKTEEIKKLNKEIERLKREGTR